MIDPRAGLQTLMDRLADSSDDERAWARRAYGRLLLAGAKSSPAAGEVALAVRHPAEPGRLPDEGQWADGVLREWTAEHPERFVGVASASYTPSWTPRTALAAAPFAAAWVSLLYAVGTLIPGWIEGPRTVGELLLFPVIGAVSVLAGGLFGAARRRGGTAVAAGVGVVAGLGSSVLLAVAATSWLTAPLPAGVPWPWVAVAACLAVAGLVLAVGRRPGVSLDGAAGDPRRWAPAADAPVTDEDWLTRYRAALREHQVRSDAQVRRDVEDARRRGEEAGLPLVEALGSPWEHALTLPSDAVFVARWRALSSVGLLALWAVVLWGFVDEAAHGGGVRPWVMLVMGALLGAFLLRRAWRATAAWRSARG